MTNDSSTTATEPTEFTPRQVELIQILQKVYSLLGNKTPTQDYFVNNPKYPGKTVFEKAFGSWNNAIRSAKLPVNRAVPTNTRKKLSNQIAHKCIQLGRAPLRKEVEEDPKMAAPDTYIRAFGPWDKVITAAGFTINWSTPEVRQRYLQALWRLYVWLNYQEPSMFDVQSSDDPDIPRMVVINNIFGGFNDFLIASGVRADYIARERAKIIAIYVQRAHELGHSPDQDDPYLPGSNKIRRFFKNHNDVLETANLLPHKVHRSNTRLLKELRDQYCRTGKTPTYESIDDDPLMAASSTYRHRFGKLENALIKAKIPLGIHRRGYEGEALEHQLQVKVSQIHKIPTQKEINDDPDMASVPTFIRYYHSWENVKTAARRYLAATS